MSRLSGRGLAAIVALALPLLFGASGCHTFKYFDVTVSFDQASFDDADIFTIARCRVLVTGADNDNFIMQKCPNRIAADPHNVGEFEFASFADSGTITFDLQAYGGLRDTPECLIGEGKVPVTVSSLTTIPTALTVTKNPAANCSSVSPVVDGGP